MIIGNSLECSLSSNFQGHKCRATPEDMPQAQVLVLVLPGGVQPPAGPRPASVPAGRLDRLAVRLYNRTSTLTAQTALVVGSYQCFDAGLAVALLRTSRARGSLAPECRHPGLAHWTRPLHMAGGGVTGGESHTEFGQSLLARQSQVHQVKSLAVLQLLVLCFTYRHKGGSVPRLVSCDALG